MKRELAAVYDELLRRYKTGAKSVYLSDESLAILRREAGNAPATSGSRAPRRPRPPAAGTGNVPQGIPPPPVVALREGTRRERWDQLKAMVQSDAWCQSQVKTGKQVVLGVGSLEARIFFCGEAPGAEEEIQGEPFVGPAGQLLTRIIQAMGLQREEVYIGNIMNYRPPVPGPVGNRAPSGGEMAYCLPYLLAQMDIVLPEVIVALGKTAVDGLLGADSKRRMTGIRGHWQAFNGIPLIPTFHPSYLLRNTALQTKRQVWEDMLAVMEKLEMPISEKQLNYFR